ncbi:DHA2 family efflux MFS transporter permease subunit [Skermanella sp. TT6]|uniref:DHA2 family efflux MFS transporter permease subunit n=1 Tax=Skermanella cutis TaxID=2775420 RepID=A0ABX7AZW7_9PROT|nr:DHA2 family efflux MFS transporter permease subunit [Skermanella sp. TT6]QQP87412.1 DHA2 family efflux MFS transporter permease subunit [Skermanella sp. TT6]
MAAGAAGARHVTAKDWIGFFAMVVGMFMAILDIQIVSSSLAEIQAGVSASADEISWVQTSYLIAEVIMIPLSGILARVMSTRWLFVVSAIGFTTMSIACAFAWNIESLILFRALQGFLGGAMIPTVFATSFSLFPADRRAGVSVMIGLVATMAPTLGPTLGGYLTQSLSWHWLFLINVGPGLVVSALVWSFVDVDKPDLGVLKGFDFPGLVFMALFLGTLEFVVEEGPRNDWFEDHAIATAAAVCAVSAVLFFRRVLTYHNPIVGLRAFKDRNFAIGCLFSFVIGVGLYGAVYIMPLFLDRIRGLNSLQIGMVMFVTGMFQFMSAPVAGILSRKMDLRLMLALGLGMFGFGVYLNSILTAESDFWELFVPQAVRGFSLMMCFIPINTLALGTLPPEQLKNASGLYNLMRNLGGAIGLAAINTVLIDRFALHMSRLSDNVTTARPGVQDMLDGLSGRLSGVIAGDPDRAALKIIHGLVEREAMVLTFSDCLLLMACVFAAAFLFMPLVRKPRAAVEGGH